MSLSHVEFFNETLFIWIVIFGIYDAFIVWLHLHVIIVKTQTFVTLADLDILFRFFGLLLPNTNKIIWLSNTYLMKVIPETRNAH